MRTRVGPGVRDFHTKMTVTIRGFRMENQSPIKVSLRVVHKETKQMPPY